MKSFNENRIITYFIISFMFLSFLTSLNSSILIINSEQKEVSEMDINLSRYNPSETFVTTMNGKKYLAKYITQEEVETMKTTTELREKGKNYNSIIDGHGTGLAAPTQEDLEQLIGKISIISTISGSKPQKPMATHDLSTEIYFPSVGDQMYQGSCGAWASTYYTYGYLEAKDYGWDASSGNSDYLMSPAWTYNKVAPIDYGSWMTTNAQILLDWGCATMSAMPYDDSDVNSWGNETAWREAPYHRAYDYYLMDFDELNPNSTIDAIKSMITSGSPVTFALDANEFSPGFLDANYIISSTEYTSTGYNHAQCIVGFNDTINDDGDIGAFRVVNSWGLSFGDNGYYWLTYETLKEIGFALGDFLLHLCVIEDRKDYLPSLIATWEFDPAPTRMINLTRLGVGPHNAPLAVKIPWYEYDGINLLPEFMSLDISDFQSYYDVNNDINFFLDVGSSTMTGIISSFKIERYVLGILQETTPESPMVPKPTPGYVDAFFRELDHELKVMLDVPSMPDIYNTYKINATVINNGIFNESNVDFFLYLNNTDVNSTTIATLLSGQNETITYLWNPLDYGTYNFSGYAPPVGGEFYTVNNFATKIIPIHEIHLFDGMYINYTFTIFGDDKSSKFNYHYDSGPIFNLDWYVYEYGSISHMYWDEDAKTRIIENSGGDGWQFGNGSHTPIWIFTEVSISDLIPITVDAEGDHLFEVTGESLYELPGIGPVSVWVLEDLTVSGGIAMYEQSTGILINGLFYYFGGSAYYTLDFVESNAEFNFTRDHELSVSLEVPMIHDILNTYTINATVTNYGPNNESNVDLFLYLDGLTVNSTTISNLPTGTSETINYEWTPTEYGLYNFTAYTPPIPDEAFINNNHVTKMIPLYELRNYIITPGFNYNWIDASGGTELFLLDDGYATASLPFDFYFYNQSFSTIYISANGYLSFTDTSPWQFSNIPFPSGDLSHTFMIAPFWDDLFPPAGGHIYVESFGSYWVVEWEGISHFNGLLVGSFEVILHETGEIAFNYDYLDYTSEGYTCGLNLGLDLQYYNLYQSLDDFTDDFSILFSYNIPPGSFDLTTNAGTPSDDDGMFNLVWTKSIGANNYSVYQYSKNIIVLNESLTILLEDTTELQLDLDGYLDGTYYFIVVAHNNYGETKSNCIEVNIEIHQPPEPFDLNTDADTPSDSDGAFNLFWTESSGANNYSVYQYSSHIIEINGSLTPLAEEITEQELPLSGYLNGRYYFIIVAHNDGGQTLSNCISVVVYYEGGGIPGYELLFIIGTLGIAIILLKKRISKKTKNNY